MKTYRFSLIFNTLFIKNISVRAGSAELAYIQARKELQIKYPVKYTLCELRRENKVYIPERVESIGQVVKMLSEQSQVSCNYQFKKPKLIIEDSARGYGGT